MSFIQEIQGEAYWEGVTAPILEVARKRLRALVKLIEIKKRDIIYTDFVDKIGAGVELTVRGADVGTDMAKFRLKARQFLQAHNNHIAVLKLRRNDPLTSTDLAELERMFVEAGVAHTDDIERLKPAGGLGLFVRSLVGLDREAAKAAFANFIAGKTLTASQVEFLDMVINHLTEKGQMEPGLLYESPFTDFDPMGVAGVFTLERSKELIGVLDDIRRHAEA